MPWLQASAAIPTGKSVNNHNEPRQGLEHASTFPGRRKYNRQGGRPGLNVDFEAVCDAVLKARNGSGETMTDVAARFGVSRGWLHKWVYPDLATGSKTDEKTDA